MKKKNILKMIKLKNINIILLKISKIYTDIY